MSKCISIKILHCARCGKDHEIEFRHFRGNSFKDADETVYDWWGLCPNTLDPVLMSNSHPDLISPIYTANLPKKSE